MLELVDAGVCGVMPGLGPADLLARTYGLAKGGRKQDAYDVVRASCRRSSSACKVWSCIITPKNGCWPPAA